MKLRKGDKVKHPQLGEKTVHKVCDSETVVLEKVPGTIPTRILTKVTTKAATSNDNDSTEPGPAGGLEESKRRETLSDAITAPGEFEVAGVKLRKPGIGTAQLLKRTGNKLFRADGQMLKLTEDTLFDHLDDIAAYIFIHAAPAAEVSRLAHGTREGFQQAVAVFAMEHLDMDQAPVILDALNREAEAIAAARVKPEPKYRDDDDDEDPNAGGQGGKQA